MTIRRVKPIARSTTPIKRSRLRQGKGAKAERETPALDAFRFAVFERARGGCEIGMWPGLTFEERRDLCGTPMTHRGDNAHHIAPSDRDAGMHDPDRGMFVCWAGHREIHARVGFSYARGLLAKSGTEGPLNPPPTITDPKENPI